LNICTEAITWICQKIKGVLLRAIVFFCYSMALFPSLFYQRKYLS